MNTIYNAGIRLYAATARTLGRLGHRKAALMTRGPRDTSDALRRFAAAAPEGAPRIWIHAASLGEFEQGRPVIEWIRREMPQARILLSFFSPSGYEVRKNFPGADTVVYLPFDTPRAADTFVDIARPTMAIFVKYELWGNYLDALRRREIPVYLISAIFRPGQIFFRPYGAMFRRMLRCFTHLFVQDDASERLLRGAGVEARDITVCGDTRFDRLTDTLRSARPVPEIEAWIDASGGRDRFTLVAGSSWGPDEDVYFPWLASHPEVRAIIAPHEFDPSRLEAMRGRLGRDLTLLHSELSSASPARIAAARYIIIDCFGLLASLYRFASMAYVGGGFGVGIHSVTEAAVFSVPVVFGPNHSRFREAIDLIACGGASSVASPKDFALTASRFLQSVDRRSEAGAAAGKYIADNVGATETIARHIFPRQ